MKQLLEAVKHSLPAWAIGACVLLSGTCWSAAAQTAANPDRKPQLVTETGMHTGPIWQIAADASCKVAVTGSHDKSVRFWDMPGGKARSVVRLPRGSAEGGKINTVAMTRDGTLAAVGGWDERSLAYGDYSVYLIDTASGQVQSRIGGFSSRITQVAFSPDGHHLAVGQKNNAGLALVDVAAKKIVYRDQAYAADIYGLAFDDEGQLFVSSFDGNIRLYANGLKLTAKAVTKSGAHPASIALDHDSRSLAVGFEDASEVEVYKTRGLVLERTLVEVNPSFHNFARVAWDEQGDIVAAGDVFDMSGPNRRALIRTWGPASGKIVQDSVVPGRASIIRSLARCGPSLLYVSDEPSIGLFSKGSASPLQSAKTIDPDGKKDGGFAVAEDGLKLDFGLGAGRRNPRLFLLDRETLIAGSGAPPPFNRPNKRGVRVTGIGSDIHPFTINGRKPLLEQFELPQTYTVRQDQKGLVVGTNFLLRAYETRGHELWKTTLPDTPVSVVFARGGSIVVLMCRDGSVHWYRWSDGHELLTFFAAGDGKTWIAWTQSGYYETSVGGEDLIGWQVNRGWEGNADYFNVGSFRNEYYRPDIAQRVLVTLDEGKAVADVKRHASIKPIESKLPPVVRILSALSTGEGTYQLTYQVRSPSGLPVDAVIALVDGRPINTVRGLGKLKDTSLSELTKCLVESHGFGNNGDENGCRGMLFVQANKDARTIGLLARAEDRTSDVALVDVASGTTEPKAKPKLFALVVGISRYRDPAYALMFASKDAEDFAGAMLRQKGLLYSDVVIKRLEDGRATASAIRDGLDWLSKIAGSDDIGLVYLAGHGVLDDGGRFYFLAADSELSHLRATAVPKEDFSDALDRVSGRAIAFLDTCHSGAISSPGVAESSEINGVINELSSKAHGIIAFTASTGLQNSEENSEWKNGAFTKAVVEALGAPGEGPKADFMKTGTVTASELDAYVSRRVSLMTNGAQTPVMIRPPTVPDFALAAAP